MDGTGDGDAHDRAGHGARRAAILTVDDDPGVSRAVARDLRRRYGERYRIVRAESGRGGAGRAARAEAARRPGGGAAGRLPDAADERHRVPRAGHGPVPGRAAGAADRLRGHRARRSTRSTSSTSTTTCSSRGTRRRRSSTRSSTTCSSAWRATDHRPVPETKVVGHRWSARSSGVREFLARNQVPYRWYSSDEPEGRRLLAAAGAGRAAAAAGDHRRTGTCWSSPTDPELAAQVGLATTPAERLLRPRRHRRRPGRARRRGVRGLRGAADRAGRAVGDRRAGRAELADRELPRLPGRRVRRAAHRPGPAAGDQVRRRDAHRPRGDRAGGQRRRRAPSGSPTARRSPRTA